VEVRTKRIVLAAALALLVASVAEPRPAAAAGDNPIVIENQQPGSMGWLPTHLGDDTNGQIKGYWSATSVKAGDVITLRVSVNPAQSFALDIYRMGWYGGMGGRLRHHVDSLIGITQRACTPDPTTGVIDCGWVPSYALTIPSDWTSGVYLGILTNAAGFQNHVIFVVKDDRPAPFLYQQSINTDQAYNNYPNDGVTGKSLYSYNSYGANTISGETRAVKVSFDRPYANYGYAQVDELEFIRWIERSGYDVTYSTDVDTHANGAAVRNHRALLSVGHDEYWSKEMRDAVESARDAGVNLAFFASDPSEVQVRFEASTAGVANRVMVCYKDAAIDPVQGPTTTVKWRNPPANRAEQSMVGIQVASMSTAGNADYVVTNSSHWLYAGTGFRDGDRVRGIVGYEMDRFFDSFPAPNATSFTLLSHSPYTDYQGAAEYANSSIYQAPSGAWVFASGTMSWSYALDGLWHQLADTRIQRTTANLLDAFLNGAPADHLVATAPATVGAGEAFDVVVTAADASGGVVPGYDGTVHFSSSDGSAALPPDSTLSGGRGSFSVTLAAAGPQSITVSDAANALSTTINITVQARAASLSVMAPATATAGTAFSVIVTAKDAGGNTVTGYGGTVHFSASDASAGVVLPPDSQLTNGQGTFPVTLAQAGAQTVTVSDTGGLTTNVTVDVRAATATRVLLATTAAPIAGVSFPFTATAQDQFGNTDTAYAGTLHFTTTDNAPGVVLPSNATLTDGRSTFAATLIKAGTQSITAADATTPAIAGDLVVMVSPAPAATLTVVAPASVKAGQSFNITVTLNDQFGNVATGYRGSVHFTTSDPLPTAVVPADHTFTSADAGSRSFSVTLWTVPSQTITARDTADSGLSNTRRVTVRLI
jgi:hypothetical protein